MFDTEDEISEEGEIKKASEKYLKEKQEKEKKDCRGFSRINKNLGERGSQ